MIEHFRKALHEARQDVCDLFIRDMMQALVSQGFTLEHVLRSLASYTSDKAHWSQVTIALKQALEELQKTNRKIGNNDY